MCRKVNRHDINSFKPTKKYNLSDIQILWCQHKSEKISPNASLFQACFDYHRSFEILYKCTIGIFTKCLLKFEL